MGATEQGPDDDGAPRAADVLTAELRPRPGGRPAHLARVAGAFLNELFWQLLPAPSVHDVVVTARDDGAEVLRVPAGEPMLAGDLLAAVRAELNRSTVEEFLRSWRGR
ncbi:hypothetical protein [Blastococcus sp. LR1]|uniref:hypothetical protein n=1 Tax=Blastococcus sp. LR1 TaxID=2877000 RepID=UPI001CCF788A|nr:hypothetical protein [Blastococcus sp. LR1]MCA0146845.1 hypothetical protein [Blastococcus sp. LR1]